MDRRTSKILAEVGCPPAPRLGESPSETARGPALFVLAGLPGVGKSTFARALGSLAGAVVLESDRLRRLLFGEPVFSRRESGLLFKAIVAAARELLSRGHAVVIDATNLSESDRQPFYGLADAFSLKPIVVLLDAPQGVVEDRLARRALDGEGYSDADAAVYHRMRPRAERVSRDHFYIDTSDPAAIEAGLAAVMAACRRTVITEEGTRST